MSPSPKQPKTMASEREEAERKTQTRAALGVGFVCIVIGFPLWWKTTEVYRVQLPYREINAMANAQVKYTVDFATIFLKPQKTKHDSDLAKFGSKLKASFENIAKADDNLSPSYRGQVRHSLEAESKAYDEATTVQELDKLLQRVDGYTDGGQYLVFVLPTDGKIQLPRPYLGHGRSVFLMATADLESLIPTISDIVREVLVNEAAVEKVFYTAKGAVLNKADKESMRSLRLYPGYEVTFSLLNPEPEVLRAEWDVRQAVKDYMQPMLKAFSPYTELNIKSQYLHHTGLGVQPSKNEETGDFRLSQESLPHIINPIESHLSSHASVNPQLNFVLYITPRSQFPLQIYHSTGKPSSTNSFLSPRWGGMLVYNLPIPENASLPATVQVDTRQAMEVFLNQLRLLLGINPQTGQVDLDCALPGRKVVSEWELDQWLRLRTIENIATSTSTLKSLAQLLEEISNIVINDDIGREVERAASSLVQAQLQLQKARHKDAFLSARQALLSSETAFFDPSLLELLYFPEDQKFAIYIPLFLPISIPVVLSVLQAFKRMRAETKLKKE